MICQPEVDNINHSTLHIFPGEERLYSSADSIKKIQEADHTYVMSFRVFEFHHHPWSPTLSTESQTWGPINAAA